MKVIFLADVKGKGKKEKSKRSQQAMLKISLLRKI